MVDSYFFGGASAIFTSRLGYGVKRIHRACLSNFDLQDFPKNVESCLREELERNYSLGCGDGVQKCDSGWNIYSSPEWQVDFGN